MKQIAPLCLLLLAAPFARGGPTETAIVAAMKLADQPNYTWRTTVVDDARTYDIEGRTERGGFTRVRKPMINAVRRRLGRSATDTQIEAIFRGNARCVFETEDGWKLLEELPPPPPPEHGIESLIHPPSGIQNPGTIGGIKSASRRRAHPKPDEGDYSNLQLAISLPHEELGIIVGSHAELHVAGDIATGTLTDLGAQLLLVHDGQNEITPLRAAGTFKLWIRDGIVAKYQVKLAGILSIETPYGPKRIEVSQTSHTTLSQIGSTTFDVPEEARRKLGG